MPKKNSHTHATHEEHAHNYFFSKEVDKIHLEDRILISIVNTKKKVAMKFAKISKLLSEKKIIHAINVNDNESIWIQPNDTKKIRLYLHEYELANGLDQNTFTIYTIEDSTFKSSSII